MEAGIFDGPQSRELLKDAKFEDGMESNEVNAWHAFKSIIQNFLGITEVQTMNMLLRTSSRAARLLEHACP